MLLNIKPQVKIRIKIVIQVQKPFVTQLF